MKIEPVCFHVTSKLPFGLGEKEKLALYIVKPKFKRDLVPKFSYYISVSPILFRDLTHGQDSVLLVLILTVIV